MRECVKRVLSALIALLLLAGQVQPALAGPGGSVQETPLCAARMQAPFTHMSIADVPLETVEDNSVYDVPIKSVEGYTEDGVDVISDAPVPDEPAEEEIWPEEIAEEDDIREYWPETVDQIITARIVDNSAEDPLCLEQDNYGQDPDETVITQDDSAEFDEVYNADSVNPEGKTEEVLEAFVEFREGFFGERTVGTNHEEASPDEAAESSDIVITLSGRMPEGADVVALEAQKSAENAGLTDILLAYDITINDGWQPEEALEVSIESKSLPDKVRVYHIGEDGEPCEVTGISAGDGRVTFMADGFSIYAITDEVYRRTYEFWDYKLGEYLPYEFDMTLPEDPDDPNHGSIIANRQILRNGDSLVVPSLPNKDGMRFLGWYTTPNADVNLTSPERGGVKNDITTDSIVTLYARYGWPVTVTWYTRQEGTPSNQVFSTQTVYLPGRDESVTVDLSDQIHPEPPVAGQGFLGWKEAGATAPADLTACTLSGNVSFYPYFSEVYEIVFEQEDEMEEYIAPIQVGPEGISGRITDKVPFRLGYTFAGWAAGSTALTDGDSSLLETDVKFDGGEMTGGVLYIQKNITLHSLWTPKEVVYRVVFWLQKASDTKKLQFDGNIWSVPEELREYDFMGTLRLSAQAGTVIPAEELRDKYTHLAGNTAYPLDEGNADFTGLIFHALKEGDGDLLHDFTVAGDGSNIIHVFYDREVVTLRFDYPDDVRTASDVADPAYTPALPASGTVTQKAITKISSADYPEDVTFFGLYGGAVADGKREDGADVFWPVSYIASGLSYTAAARTMQYAGGSWTQKSASESVVSENSRMIPTRWVREGDGRIISYQETFGISTRLTPDQTVENLCLTDTDSSVSYYKENEQAAYPSPAVYTSTPALTYLALSGETVTVENPFEGYELDFFTYTDSRGTPIRREAGASLTQDQCILTGGSFTNLKIYCKRKVYHIILHNGQSEMEEAPGVKYGSGLATDYVKSAVTEPDIPDELKDQAEKYEFAGWFLDEECTIYLDCAGMKAGARSKLMLQYDQIQMIVSVYDFRPAGGDVIPALRMSDGDLHLFAGWTRRRVLVELEPDGGELAEDTPTFFWKKIGDTLPVYSISRDYIPAVQAQDPDQQQYIYHIHTYDQSVKDNDTYDRTARYLPSTEEDEGTKYVCSEGSYRFLGWFRVETSANGSEVLRPYDHETLLMSDVKLRAQWSRLGVYRIAYEKGEHGRLTGNAGSAAYRDHATIALNGEVTADKGYVFTGWKIRRPDGSGEFYDTLYSSGDELAVNADQAEITWDEYAGEPRGVITLVAQYEPVRGTSITYFVNGGVYVGAGGEDLSDDPELLDELKERLIRDYGENAAHHPNYDGDGNVIGYTITGIEINANLITEDGTAFVRSGYKLMGWSTDPDGEVELPLHTGGYFAASDPHGSGFVLYAVWKPEKQVIYNLQGGTWNDENGSEYRQEEGSWIYGAGNGEQAPVPYAPTKEGYAFAGWATSSNARSGLQTMPRVTKSVTLYAVWTTNVILRFDLKGGTWESLVKGMIYLDKNYYGVSVSPGSSYILPADSPVRKGGYLFHKWEQGSYLYAAGDSIKTSAEQAGQTVTLTAIWSEGVPAVNVLVGADDSITMEDAGALIGAREDGEDIMAPQEIPGFQYLFVVYDEEPESKVDIAEHYRVTGIRRLGENTYQVSLANGQTRIHYPDSVEKLQAVYIENRPVDVCFKRMNVYEDGLDNMNLTLTSIREDPYMTLSVGKVDIQAALPKPKDYAKNGSTNWTSYTYAIGRKNAENMYAIDTMTQTKLWIRQTLNGFAFSVNGQEWKDLDREEGLGKDVAVYIIYDNRVETPTTINHTVYGLKADKEKLFTYNVYVKGRWGFNISSAAYFLNKPDDPSEELNSYTVALQDGEKVLIPLHIDYLTGKRQEFKPGDLFYDMFGNDYPTTVTNRSELRIWQEVEMRRMSELPFTKGTFETSIQMRCLSSSNHNVFNGYDRENHLWLKQLGISKYYTNTFSHSFIYTRTSLDVPIHVLELTRDGYVLRDEEWMKTNVAGTLSVTADPLTVDEDAAGKMVHVPEGYSLQGVRYGLSLDELSGSDKDLVLRLAGERNDPTLFHVYDYESAEDAANAATRSLVPDGAEVYLVYYRFSQTDIPVEYVKKDASGAFVKVDLAGYGIKAPNVTVTNTSDVDFRSCGQVKAVNEEVEELESIYLTGRMLLADQKGRTLAVYEPGAYGDWDGGREVLLRNSETGVLYEDENGTPYTAGNLRVQIEVANNTPLRIVGRLWQRGTFETNTGVFGYLPKDMNGRVAAAGNAETMERIGEDFEAFQEKIPYAADKTASYQGAGLGNSFEDIYGVAYCTDTDGYRYWAYKESENSPLKPLAQILYADYDSTFSPVNVRYVEPDGNGRYAEVIDLEEDVERLLIHTFDVSRDPGNRLYVEVADALRAIDEGSALYRTTGTFALGSSDLANVYYIGRDDGSGTEGETGGSDSVSESGTDGSGLTEGGSGILLIDSREGLRYRETGDGGEGTLIDAAYPDVYVILQPIATLTVSKVIDDASGFAHFAESFDIAISLSLDGGQFNGTFPAVLSCDTTLPYAVPVQEDGTSSVDTCVEFTNGKTILSLSHGQSISIPDLPRGTEVTVSEKHLQLYEPTYKIRQGARVTDGNSFILDRHTTQEIINISRDVTDTGRDFSDRSAYAFLLAGAVVYVCYLAFRKYITRGRF